MFSISNRINQLYSTRIFDYYGYKLQSVTISADSRN